MKILYCAIDQQVPGTRGGSVHVQAAAEGLAARGHEVHVLATLTARMPHDSRVSWHTLAPPLGAVRLRLTRAPAVLAIARSLQPDAIIERYHNFGGEGIRAASRTGALAVLEVNAPVVDYPGSPKRALDRTLIVEPMRRWRDWQCRSADLLVTPSASILPRWVSRERIVEIEWGADTVRFHPGAGGRVPYPREHGHIVAVFAGAFRRWHGAVRLVDAIRRLRARQIHAVRAVCIGEGPELPATRRAATGLDGVMFTGAVPHGDMPAALAAADIGVAPFDPGAHPPLALGFYWSPLKVFEYMASGLPVVAPAIAGMRRILEDGREGLLYDPDDPGGLAAALERLMDPDERRRLGVAARARAVRDFSWARHCETLEAAIQAALARRGSRNA
jgi:glycosyltransferase involved in cell wall biosynthesis